MNASAEQIAYPCVLMRGGTSKALFFHETDIPPPGAARDWFLKCAMKPLGVSSKSRYAGLPKVPTIAEQGYPGFEVASWTAVMAPAHTPPNAIAKWVQAAKDTGVEEE